MKSTLAPAVMDCPIEQRCTVTLNLLRVGSYFFFDITAISCYFEDQSETKKDMTIFWHNQTSLLDHPNPKAHLQGAAHTSDS